MLVRETMFRDDMAGRLCGVWLSACDAFDEKWSVMLSLCVLVCGDGGPDDEVKAAVT